MWRLPKIGDWPKAVHVTEEPSPGGRSTTSIARHTVGLPGTSAVIESIRVTTLARTVVDLAARTTSAQRLRSPMPRCGEDRALTAGFRRAW
jgi:hypothetical protein